MFGCVSSSSSETWDDGHGIIWAACIPRTIRDTRHIKLRRLYRVKGHGHQDLGSSLGGWPFVNYTNKIGRDVWMPCMKTDVPQCPSICCNRLAEPSWTDTLNLTCHTDHFIKGKLPVHTIKYSTPTHTLLKGIEKWYLAQSEGLGPTCPSFPNPKLFLS